MKTIIIAALLLAAVSAQAQVRKCTGPDGKVTYSDALCSKDTANESGVNTGANTIDSSGFRQEAQNSRADKLRADAKASGTKKCTFSYYSMADSKGKELAEAATKECYSNMAAKETGVQTSLDAYNMWKDHHATVANKRNAQMAAQPKQMNCRPNGMGGLVCN